MAYQISKAAQNDIENIWLYTFETWSVEQADRYFKLIFDEFEYLANHPESGTNCNHIRKGYYKSRVKSHFIFYRFNAKKNEIEIIRILHQQMDIESRLNE